MNGPDLTSMSVTELREHHRLTMMEAHRTARELAHRSGFAKPTPVVPGTPTTPSQYMVRGADDHHPVLHQGRGPSEPNKFLRKRWFPSPSLPNWVLGVGILTGLALGVVLGVITAVATY